MNCRQADKLCEAYVDGRLPDGQRARLEAHLGSCASCRADVAAARRLADELRPALYQALGAPTLSYQVEAQIRQRVARSGRLPLRLHLRRVASSLAWTAAVFAFILVLVGLYDVMVTGITATPVPLPSPSETLPIPTSSATPTPIPIPTFSPSITTTPQDEPADELFPVPVISPTTAPELPQTGEPIYMSPSPTSWSTPTPPSTPQLTPTPSPTLAFTSTPLPTPWSTYTPSSTPTTQPTFTPTLTIWPTSTPLPTGPPTSTPLPTPTANSFILLVDPVISPTDLLTQTITGETAPGASVDIIGEGGWVSGMADANGDFAIEMDLALGTINHLEVVAYDRQDWISTTVDRNGDPLEIEQTSPPPSPMTLLVDLVTSPTDQPTQTITGETAPLAWVSIVDLDGWGWGWGEADANGDFAIEVALTLGALNRLEVSACDGNGGPGAGDYASTTVDRNGDSLEVVQVSR